MRTVANITINNEKYTSEGQNRKNLNNFKSCEFKPIKLRKDQDNVEVIYTLPPDPLHINLLGPVNDALTKCEEHYPTQMAEYYQILSIKKSGQGPGGKFNGPSIKSIIREDNLNMLTHILPVEALPFFDYFRECR